MMEIIIKNMSAGYAKTEILHNIDLEIKAGDKVFIGGQSAFVAHIITSKPDEINRLVIDKLDRTSTIMDVTGGYSGEGKKMLMVSFTMKEYSELMNIINKTDKEAFMTVNQAHEINGEGWSKYEHKKKK
jgi:uncharacterized membrane-anchored protein YitT (DUF2179 family)